MKYEFPISGSIIVDTEDDQFTEKVLAFWLFEIMRQNQGTNFNLPDVFDEASRPQGLDIVIQIDHNHVVVCPEPKYSQIMEEAREYQIKKLSKFLPQRKKAVVLAALKQHKNAD